MSDLTVKTDVFEGPLDLLLHLIQKLELDIYDIPIAEITSQYMDHLHTMKELELEIAGDYLVMAATLMAIKSAMLLPRKEAADEFDEEAFLTDEEDPRETLTEMLIEYQTFKQAAQKLNKKQEERRLLYSKEPSDLSHYQTNIPLPPNQVGMNELRLAFTHVLKRKALDDAPPRVVESEGVSIHEKMEWIEDRLRHAQEGEVVFTQLFESPDRTEVVTIFLALLELMKENKIKAEQEERYGEIVLSFFYEEREISEV